MKKKKARTRFYVELKALWGSDDAESTIKISRRLWSEIQKGAEYATSAWSWYEGKRTSVDWKFAEGEVSIDGDDGMECVVGLPVSELVAQTTTSG